MSDKADRCNTCGGRMDVDPGCRYASLKNRRFLATLDDDGNVIQECCEACQQEAIDEFEDEE